MAELTIDQVLQHGIAAHKAGQVQEADRFYTAILKAQPKHPEANHNMGVLAVGVGKIQEALPFFKTAMEENQTTAQFWISYIDALIKLDKLANAKALLNQAKTNGFKDDDFDKLEQRLNAANKEYPLDDTLTETLETNQSYSLCTAIQLRENGEFDQAIELLEALVNQSPEDVNMLSMLAHCCLLGGQVNEAKLHLDRATTIAPNNASVRWNTARLKLKEQKPLEALNVARDTSQRFPDDVEGMGVLGACLRVNGEFVESLVVLNRAIELDPSYPEVLINRGLIRLSQGNTTGALVDLDLAHRLKPHIREIWDLVVELKIEVQEYSDAILLLINIIEVDPDNAKWWAALAICNQNLGNFGASIEAYSKAIAIKPDYAEAYANLGSALKEQGKLEEAIACYNKALAIKPDNAETFNNIAVTFQEQGKLDEAIEAFKKALAIKPDYAAAIENSQNLAVQLLPFITNFRYNYDKNETELTSKVTLGPKFQVHKLIETFLKAQFSKARSHNKNFKICDQNLLDRLKPQDKIFCHAYSSFIGKLLEANWDDEPTSENIVYHLGESHSLSYAHRNITVDGSKFRITPRIIFGAKAFHFSQTRHNAFKALAQAHFLSLPKNSKVFISFGEIDCRPNEGFITAAKKLAEPLDNIITKTAMGYVQWFLEQNKDQGHRIYFINVPAPVYHEKLNADINSEMARTVVLFNTALKKYSLKYGFDIIDVFSFTVARNGFSNNCYHIDRHHLGVKALVNIEQQIT